MVPEYRCPDCGATFAATDVFCSACGASVPHQADEGLVEAKERHRAAHLVAALLRRMGVNPVGARVDSRHWRIRDGRGEVLLSLSVDGEVLRFQAPLSRVPLHAHEAAYRFLLTYSGASAGHVGPAIRGGAVELAFSEITSFLAGEEVARKLAMLRDEAERLRPILVAHFGAEPVERVEDGFVR